MDKVVLFGLGNVYIKNSKVFEKLYQIVGYCDTDEKKMNNLPKDKREKAIALADLKAEEIKYDYILITTANFFQEIRNNLIKLGIDERKIKAYPYEKEYNKIWGVEPLKGVSYSGMEEGLEDIILDSIREKLKIPYEKMKYIELGVMDPICGNNTYYFYKRGASGILVEANPDAIDIIREIRKRDLIINKAIYEGEETSKTFYISKNRGLCSIIKEHIEDNTGWKDYPIVNEMQIPTIHINDVFKMLGEDDSCDLLSIDIEGYDLQALSALNFNKYRPKIIIAELNGGYSENDKYYQQIVNLLLKNGYILYVNNLYNGIFVDGRYKAVLE